MKALIVLDEKWDSALTDLAIKVGLSLSCKVAFAVIKGGAAHRRLKGQKLLFIEDPRKGLPLKAFLSLKRAFETFLPDVVLTIRGDEMLFSSLLKRKFKYRLFRVHGEQKGIRNNYFNRLLHRNFIDGVIVTSSKLINPVIEGLNRVLIHGLVDTEKFFFDERGRERFRKELGLKEEKLIGVVGRLDLVKGHSLFLKAISFLRRNDYKAVIVGQEKGVKLKDLVSLARSLGLLNRVYFIKDRREDIREIMSAIDLAVVPSIGSEVILRAPLEFMACRTALVSTNVGALPEVIKPPFGISVEPNPKKLAKAIDSFLNKDLVELGTIAKEEAYENYSIKSFSSIINSFICGL